MNPNRIGIIGGGIAGYAFASHCEKLGIPYTLFVLNNNSGGYGLTMQGAKKILKFLSITFDPTEINKLKRFVCINESLNVIKCTHHSNGNYVVPRLTLIDKFKETITQSNIIVIKNIYTLTHNENNVAINIDGVNYTFDYVVGADGINSRIRELIGIKKEDCIVSTEYLLRIYQFKENSELRKIENDVREYVSSDSSPIRIFIKPCGKYGTSAQVVFPLKYKNVIESMIPENIFNQFSDEKYYETLLCTSKSFNPVTLPNLRVILLGDSFNAMVPYNGNGANTAIINAHELAMLINLNKYSRKNITNDFYLKIQERTTNAIKHSYEEFKRAHHIL